jgi:hypothetical protein
VNSKDLDSGNTKIGAFAASNSALTLAYDGLPMFGTSGPGGPWLYVPDSVCTSLTAQQNPAACFDGSLRFEKERLPMAGDSASAGIFSLAVDSDVTKLVAVGGDYGRPNEVTGTAAATIPWMLEPRRATTAAAKPPHGYRSAVAWDAVDKVWIAVGANGSDVSYDDGGGSGRKDCEAGGAAGEEIAVRRGQISAQVRKAGPSTPLRCARYDTCEWANRPVSIRDGR